MHQNIDLIELLVALNEEGAEYFIVGAYAFAFHGRPRATKDIDLLVRPTNENAARVWRALSTFGAPLSGLTPSDLASPGTIFSMGRDPNRIDIITSIDGVTFEDGWESRVRSTYEGVPVAYMGRSDLIANKKVVGLPQDLADVAYLESEGRSL
jgi:hypothetical protein